MKPLYIVLFFIFTFLFANGQSNYADMGRCGTQVTVDLSNPDGLAYLSDVSGASFNYNTYVFINDIYVGANVSGSYPVLKNAKYIFDKYGSKSTISNTTGYPLLADLWQAINDPQWVSGYSQEIVSTYDPNTPMWADAPTPDGQGVLLAINNWNSVAMRDAPALSMPQGKLWGGTPLDYEASIDDYVSHGWTVFLTNDLRYVNNITNQQRYSLPNAQEFSDAIGGQPYADGPAMPSAAQGVAVGKSLGERMEGVLGDQMGEGNLWVSPASDGYLSMWQVIIEGNPTVFAHGNYGQPGLRYFADCFNTPGGGPRNPTDSSYKDRYASQESARTSPDGQTDPFYALHDNNISFSTIGMKQLVQNYPRQINSVDIPYAGMHFVDVMLKQDSNNPPIGFFWPMRESTLDGAISGVYNWQRDTTNPAGQVIKPEHSISSFINAEIFGFDMTIRGSGVFMWHNDASFSDDRNAISQNFEGAPQDTWYPASGSPSTFPFVTSGPTAPNVPLVAFDACHMGRDKAIKALNYLGCSFPLFQYSPLDGGNTWSEAPDDGSAILYAAANYTPIAMLLTNPENGKQVVWAVDPYCNPSQQKKIVVQTSSSSSLSFTLIGNSVHVVLVGASLD